MNNKSSLITGNGLKLLIVVILVIFSGMLFESERGLNQRIAAIDQGAKGWKPAKSNMYDLINIRNAQDLMRHFRGYDHRPLTLNINDPRFNVILHQLDGRAISGSSSKEQINDIVHYVLEIRNNESGRSRFYRLLNNTNSGLENSEILLQHFLDDHVNGLWNIIKNHGVFDVNEFLLNKFMCFITKELCKNESPQQQPTLINSQDYSDLQDHLNRIIQISVDGHQWDERNLIDVIVPQLYNLNMCQNLLFRLQSLLNKLLQHEDFNAMRLEIMNVNALISGVMERSFDSGAALLLNDRLRMLLAFARSRTNERLQNGPLSTTMMTYYEQLREEIGDWLQEARNMSDIMQDMLRMEIGNNFVMASNTIGARRYSLDEIDEMIEHIIKNIIDEAYQNMQN